MGYTSGCLGSVVQNDPLTAAWAEGVVNAGGTVSPFRRSTVDTLIKGLRADGVLPNINRLWLFAAENTQSALLDVITRTTAVPVGSPTFTTNAGYTGTDSSTTVYIDTKTPAGALAQAQLGSLHLSVWCNTIPVSGVNGGAAIGVVDSSIPSWSQVYPNYNTGLTFNRVNANANHAGATSLGVTGHYLGNRVGTGGSAGYVNGSLFESRPAANAGTAFPSGNFFVLAFNNSTAAQDGCGAQISAASLGAGLADSDILNFYNRLRTYMTTLGLS